MTIKEQLAGLVDEHDAGKLSASGLAQSVRAILATLPEPGVVSAAQYREACDRSLYNEAAALALAKVLSPGHRLIYRSAFRWLDADGNVLSNHYDGMDAAALAAEFHYDLAADLGFAAIIRDQAARAVEPCDMGELCIDCQPREGSACPTAPAGEVAASPLLAVAQRNIRQFLAKASFSSEVDRWSAGQCLDVMDSVIAASQPAPAAQGFDAEVEDDKRAAFDKAWNSEDYEGLLTLYEEALAAKGVGRG